MSDDPEVPEPIEESERPPGAPDTPTFWALSKIVLDLDAEMSDSNLDTELFRTRLAEYADPDSVIYVGFQRGMRMAIIRYGSLLDEMTVMLGGAWTEGFLVGMMHAGGDDEAK